jgi:iron complex outermembrane receptor protein
MRLIPSITVSGLMLGALCHTSHAIAGAKLPTAIPPQRLDSALTTLAGERDFQLVYLSENIDTLQSRGAKGELTSNEALVELLSGTGLTYRYIDDKTVTIYPRHRDVTDTSAESSTRHTRENVTSDAGDNSTEGRSGTTVWDSFRLAQSDGAGGTSSYSANSRAVAASADGRLTEADYAEVKITARKREERSQDVPASVTAVSGATLEDLNIVSVTELNHVAPGLTFVTNPARFGTGPAIALRGISTLTQSPAIQDSVGTVIDGIPISRAKAGAFPDLNDVSHVEVLPGPQGTLFGKNATAGVVSISTKDPTKDFEIQGDVDYSSYNDVIVRAAASGPLLDNTLTGRLSVYYKNQDGYIDNIFDGSKWGDERQKGERGKLIYTPTANDTIKLSEDFLQENNDGGMQTVRAFLPSTPQYIRTAISPIVWTDNDEVDAHSLGSNVQRTGGGALQWNHLLGSHTLTAIAGYRLWTQDSNTGTYSWPTTLNGAPGDGGNTIFTVDAHQYSGELRIASPTGQRVDYVAGLFLFDDDIATSLFDPLPGLLALSSATGTLTGRQQRNWTNDTKTFNHAAFGEANTHITDHLTLTTGLRWTHEKVDASIVGLPTSAGLQRLVVPLGTTTASKTGSDVSWRAGPQWRFDEDKMLYFSAATGWKGPGFNVVSSIAGNAQPVNPETSTSYEAGWKSQFLDRRLTANFDVYHAIYKNYQTQGFVTLPGTQVATVVIANAAKLQTQGAEIQLAARVTDSTEISWNSAYIDATFKQFPSAQCYSGQPTGPGNCVNGQQNLSGKRLANTPKLASNIMGKQSFNIPGVTWKGAATVNYSWHSNIQWDVLGSPYSVEHAYGLLGASLGAESRDSRFGIQLYGKNLTNTFHTEGILIGTTVTQFLPLDYRRVLGIDVRVKF